MPPKRAAKKTQPSPKLSTPVSLSSGKLGTSRRKRSLESETSTIPSSSRKRTKQLDERSHPGSEESDSSAVESVYASSDDESYASDDSELDRPVNRPKPQKSTAKSTPKGPITEETGFGAAVSIPIPPRPVPDRKGPKGAIYDFTTEFLGGLKANNERDWFKLHENPYQASKENFLDFVDVVMAAMREKDVTIRDVAAKEAIFRINRDIRFSTDKTPYKTSFSAAFSRSGKKGPHAGYYISIGSTTSFAGGGLWNPTSAQIASIRTQLSTNPQPLLTIINSPTFKRAFPPGGIKVLQKSAESNDAVLKTAPKGYPKDHPHIELLRLKAFVVGKEWGREDVLKDKYADNVVEALSAIVPLITLLNTWI